MDLNLLEKIKRLAIVSIVTDDYYSEDVSNNSEFDLAIENLAPLTTYYVRAFATNREGTSYDSDEITFTTK